jgi:hypothetical protein
VLKNFERPLRYKFLKFILHAWFFGIRQGLATMKSIKQRVNKSIQKQIWCSTQFAISYNICDNFKLFLSSLVCTITNLYRVIITLWLYLALLYFYLRSISLFQWSVKKFINI